MLQIYNNIFVRAQNKEDALSRTLREMLYVSIYIYSILKKNYRPLIVISSQVKASYNLKVEQTSIEDHKSKYSSASVGLFLTLIYRKARNKGNL